MSGFNPGWSWAVDAGILVADEEAQPIPTAGAFVPATAGNGESVKIKTPISSTLTFKLSRVEAWDLWALLNKKKLAFSYAPGWNKHIRMSEEKNYHG